MWCLQVWRDNALSIATNDSYNVDVVSDQIVKQTLGSW